MRTAHRKDSRSRRRSAPDSGTGTRKIVNQPFCKRGSRLSAATSRGTEAPPTFRLVAHAPIRLITLLLPCILLVAMPSASFAQDEEEEASNAKPDAGGIVIEPSSGK